MPGPAASRLVSASLVVLAAFTMAQNADAQQLAPTVNDLTWATVPLDGGGTTTLELDFWHATAPAERAPLAIWIHGGGWQSGSYNNSPPGLAALLDAGFAVASIEYRLSGVAIFPAQIHDVKGAVRFLRAHANEYDLDPSRFAAWGSSAGGHLTTLLAVSSGAAELEGTTGGNLDVSSMVQTAVDYFGPTNILSMNADFDPPGSGSNHDGPGSAESRLIGFDGTGQGIGVLRANLTNPSAPFPQKAALVALTNPLNFIDSSDPPIFIAHGTVDSVVPPKQSDQLAAALTAAGIDNALRPVIDAGHGFGAQTAAVNEEAIAFLSARLLTPAGDFDRNGAVDGNDFLEWQRQFGGSVAIAGLAADANVDGQVTAADLAIWRERFGASVGETSAANSTAIPEPAAFTLFAMALAIAAGVRRRT